MLLCYLLTVGLWPLSEIEATPNFKPLKTENSHSVSLPNQGESSVMAVGFGNLANSPNSTESKPIASITKVITALVVLDKKPLDSDQPGPNITLTEKDTGLYEHYLSLNGSIAPAPAGLNISQKDAITAMLLPSANNYADTLATWAYGSMDNYVSEANRFLRQHNLSSTVVADASGFSPLSQSSADDLLVLGNMIIDNPVLSKIVAQKSASINGIGELKNTNFLLDQDGVIGIKTGNTDEAKRCLLFAARYNIGEKPTTIVAAVIGQETFVDLFNNTSTVLSSAKQLFSNQKIVDTQQSVGTYKTPWGSSAEAVVSNELSAVIASNKTPIYKLDLKPYSLKSNSAEVGSLAVTSGEATSSTPLKLASKLNGPSYIWRVSHPLTVFGFTR